MEWATQCILGCSSTGTLTIGGLIMVAAHKMIQQQWKACYRPH